MAQLPLEEAIDRFKGNEERIDQFVNAADGYTSSGGQPVESLPAFLSRVEQEVGTVADNLAAAQAAKTAAEAARDAAQLSAGVYVSTAAGMAAVADGAYFSVPSADSSEYLILYRRSGAAATEIKRYPSTAALAFAEANTDYGRGDYKFAIADESNNVIAWAGEDGKLKLPKLGGIAENIFDIQSKIQVIPAFEEVQSQQGAAIEQLEGVVPSGYSTRTFRLAFVDDEGRISHYIDHRGHLIVGKTDITNINVAVEDVIQQVADNSLDIDGLELISSGTRNIACWGDSMTQLADFPQKLQALMPERIVRNFGISGQTSSTIALRQGGLVPVVTVTGDVIPESGPVACTVDGDGVTRIFNASISSTGTLGGVPGTLAKSNGVWTFTRSTPGAQKPISRKTPFITTSGDANRGDITVLWLGRNNWEKPDVAYQDTVDCVEHLSATNKKFIVSAFAPGDSESGQQTGVTAKSIIMADMLRNKYPRNFIDLRQVLINAYDPNTPQDVIDFAARKSPPSSLTSDGLHLNDAGAQVVANAIFEFITTKGW